MNIKDPSRPAKILIVEDEAVIALDIKDHLERSGYLIVGLASDTSTALQMTESSCPDLALVDIHLSHHEDGIELASRIEKEARIPIIFLTADSSAGVMGRVQSTQTYGYLLKPIDYRILVVTIEMALRRHQAELRLAVSERNYRLLAENVQDVIWVLELKDMRFSYISPSILGLRGLSVEEAMAESVSQTLHPESAKMVSEMLPARLEEMAQPGKITHPYVDLVRQPHKDGSWVWVEIVSKFFLDEHGMPRAIQGVSRAVTDRVRIQEALRESQENYLALFNGLSDLVIVHEAELPNGEGLILNINDFACQALGYRPDELIGKPIALIALAPDSAQFDEKSIAVNFQSGQDVFFEHELATRDGQRIPVEAHARHIQYGGRKAILSIERDIRPRIEIQETLRQSRQRLEIALQAARMAVYEHNLPLGDEIFVNSRWAEILGYQLNELPTGQALSNWWEAQIHPDDTSLVLDTLEKFHQGKNPLYDQTFRQKHRSGEWVYIHSIASATRRDGDGKVKRVVGIELDITEQKTAEAEIQQLNTQLENRVIERTIELEAALRDLETFTHSGSHELKTPLRAIEGFSHIIEEDYSARLDDVGRLYLERIRRAAVRMNQIIDDLLAYIHLGQRELTITVVNVPLVVEMVLEEFSEAIKVGGVDVVLRLDCEFITTEMMGFQSILRCLVDNAINFSTHSETPRLELGSKNYPGHHLFWVKDNGIGFDMKYHDTIFGVFQRLHRDEEYPGNGMGLAIARKAVQRMNGKIWAESSPGQGTTFFLELPA